MCIHSLLDSPLTPTLTPTVDLAVVANVDCGGEGEEWFNELQLAFWPAAERRSLVSP